MVVDWRAAVSLPFYRATSTEPMGVDRRRLRLLHGRLTTTRTRLTGASGDVDRCSLSSRPRSSGRAWA